MEILSIILLILGYVSIVIEMLIPGFGIFGIAGVISIAISWGITIFTIPIGIFIVMAEIILSIICFVFIIKKMKKMQIYGKVILTDVIGNNKKTVANLEQMIGKEGTTKTDMKPFGKVEINGMTLDAYSESGYIKVLSKIKVVRVIENKMYVAYINKN